VTNSNWSSNDGIKKKTSDSRNLKKNTLRTAPNVDGFATSTSFNKGGVGAKRAKLKNKR
jgi:hypothetical protein